jgi:hypothetical protein
MPKLTLATLNIRGMEGKEGFHNFLHTFRRKADNEALSVMCVQEHNLTPQLEDDLKRLAQSKDFELEVSYGRHEDPASTRGGVMTIVDTKKVNIVKVEHKMPGFLMLKLNANGREITVANAYAPASSGLHRIDFFNAIKTKLTLETFVCGDWNCVPDVTLDVRSANPLAYENRGSTLLETIMDDNHLIDERRLQLGNDREYTRDDEAHGTSTRIDRWYTPDDVDYLQTIRTDNSFIFKKKASDHRAVYLTLDDRTGELGHDRVTLDEELLLDETIQYNIEKIVKEAYQGDATHHSKWKRAHERIYNLLLTETKARRKRDRVEIKRLEGILRAINTRNRHKPSTPVTVREERNIQREIYELKHPEVTREPSEREARAMYERSEVCTRAMFSTYKSRAKQQWVNTVKKATWEEGKEPTFQGNTKKTSEVGQEFVKLYKMIFAKKDIQGEEVLLQELSNNRILKASREMLDAPFTTEEVLHVMESLPTAKQAGPNRIPSGLYKYMSSIFAQKFTDLINETRRSGKLPKHFLEGDITMMYKNKGDREDPRHYRPITLLNSDYKVFTRVLARRMMKVVHEFVSECQKGFVPDTFIAEATMLTKMIEAYINDDEDGRQGVILFLDMEKAFDRVSYDFTLRGLKALGFGKHFRKWIGMMYDVKNAPKRRMYINGYYSSWFRIQSGVAQGCPLSPLLFLVCAQALKISIEMEKGLKGIKIGEQTYKISQFADDTTLFMHKISELKHAEEAVAKWGRATGMRENIMKREGVAMGKYRGKDLGRGVKWATEGNFCVSLGVPIGNELDESKWWGAKINTVRKLASRWGGLYRNKYFGRNLIVQGCYFGRLRYWLYSTRMTRAMQEVVQRDADILWWSKDPAIQVIEDAQGNIEKNPKRIRRWVAKNTAIAPRSEGGLNNMSWADHVSAVQAEWMIRYLDPGRASWKDILDSWILYTAGGKCKYPEGRAIILQNLSTREKAAMISRIPKKAEYLRQCLRDFWKLQLTPLDPKCGVTTESPWHGHRWKSDAPNHIRAFCKHTLQITRFADFMNKDTNRPFTKQEWREWVHESITKLKGVEPDNIEVRERAKDIYKIQKAIPDHIWVQLLREYRADPKINRKVYLVKGRKAWPAIVETSTHARVHAIDNVGKARATSTLFPLRNFTVVEAHKWREKWGGPKGDSYAQDVKWKLPGDDNKGKGLNISQLTIKYLTKHITSKRKEKPASEAAWDERIPGTQWKQTWAIRPLYTTPRDQCTWLQIQHRNLWVAKHGGWPTITCACQGCQAVENQEHLLCCPIIERDFWSKIHEFITDIGMAPGTGPKYWLTGQKPDGTTAGREETSIISWAWRTLYAAIIGARSEGKNADLKHAFYRVTLFTISRVKAYGAKWRRWFIAQKNRDKPQEIAEAHKEKKLITTEDDGKYEINKTIYTWHIRAKHMMRTR